MKKLLALLMTFVFILAGCSPQNTPVQSVTDQTTIAEQTTQGESSTSSSSTETIAQVAKIKIVSTLFPQYDFVKVVGGDFVESLLLIPPGVEVHSYEPTPKDIIALQEADIVLYTSDAMEPYIKSFEGINAVDLSQGIVLKEFDSAHDEHDHDDTHDDHDHEEDHDHDEADSHDDHDHDGVDPHYWLSLDNAAIMVDTITKELVKIAPAQKEYFESRASAYKTELENLHKEILNTTFSSKHIVSGGHFAFAYFASEHGFTFSSPYTGYSPDSEPTPQNIAEIVNFMKNSNIKTIYFEELVNNKVAEAIKNEVGGKLLMLHGAHNLTKEELDRGVSYLDIQKQNFEVLKEGQN